MTCGARGGARPEAEGEAMENRPILVIDDDPRSSETVTTMLADAGFEVLSALDGPTGMATARAAQPAVILLDMMMPGLDGIGTCERLKGDPVLRDIPVVGFTGSADLTYTEKALRAGAKFFLPKPFGKESLVQVVKLALKSAQPSEMNHGGIKMLLITDNPGDSRLIQEMLAEASGAQFHLECVDRLATGLVRLATESLDVLLLDLSLPDSQGFDTFARAHARAPNVPIILLTGFDDEQLAMKAVREGAQDYFVKHGLDGNILMRSVRHAIERKRGEAELNKTRARLEHLLASSPSIIYTTQASGDLACSFISENFQSIMGYAPREMLDDPKYWVNHLHPQDAPRVLADVPRLIARGGGTLEYRFRHRDGSYRWVQDAFKVIYNKAGRPSEIVGSWADITERKRAEEELRESNRRLEQALAELKATQQQVLQEERLRALGKMASGIAHDFNNTLMPILGYSELLLDRPEQLDNKEKVTHYLDIMNTAAKDATSVVRRLREFYRSPDEEETFQPIDLNQLVKQVLMFTEPRWKDQAMAAGITIGNETDLQEVPLVAGNEAELREALTNVIFNAVDAMPEGGTTTLRTRPDGDHVALEISDTGTGMTDEVRQRCLEPFFTTKDERGTGLGLAMVYGIVQRHHGTINIESELGQGTTFIIRLPVNAEVQAEGREQHAENRSRGLSVLVADDEQAVREVVTEYLVGDGHTVETATNGREGLEKFQGAGWFDVIVTDQGMPEMSGNQLAAAIKRVAPNKPVILLTGFGDLIKASDETPAGVDLILSKPVTLASLREAVAKMTAE